MEDALQRYYVRMAGRGRPIKFKEVDDLYFHHHVVTTVDKYSQEVEDKKFVVRPDQAIAHKNKDGVIKSLGEWILVEPVEQKDKLQSEVL